MLPIDQAIDSVVQHTAPLPIETVPLSSSSLGLVLGEDILAEENIPSCDKSLVDGYAVRRADLDRPGVVLRVKEEIFAGGVPTQPVGPGEAARIMTGAPLPDGADAIVMVEETEPVNTDSVRIRSAAAAVGENILRAGSEVRAGEPMLKAGSVLRPPEIGLLASVGRTRIRAHRRPVVAIVSTGDELVEASAMPGAGQIRNSNGPMLTAAAVRAGALPRYLGIAGDCPDRLATAVREGLKSDVLVLSGGVSAGKKDLVPGVLEQLGVAPVFHRVAIKPGKPILFGTKGSCAVFGLPGNPVSSLVGFELFVRTALRRLLGYAASRPQYVRARISEPFRHRANRPTYHPAHLTASEEGWYVRTVPWFGSANLRAISNANAFAVLAPDQSDYNPGDAVSVLPLEYESIA